jgi:hypothetical protein
VEGFTLQADKRYKAWIYTKARRKDGMLTDKMMADYYG